MVFAKRCTFLFIFTYLCFMKGEWSHHLGIPLRQRSLYQMCSATVLQSSTHFLGFCLGNLSQ